MSEINVFYPQSLTNRVAFAERVGEAQRVAVREMKDLHEKRGPKGRKGKGRGRDEMDREEG